MIKAGFKAKRKKRKSKPPIIREKRDWSDYQLALFNDTQNGEGNTVVDAVPGSGKTTTAIENIYYLPEEYRRDRKTLMTAFSKDIATTLESKIQQGIAVETNHRLGYKTVLKNWGHIYGLGQVDKDCDSLFNLVMEEVGESMTLNNLRQNLVKAIVMSKTMLADTHDQIEDVCLRDGISYCKMDPDDFVDIIYNIMQKTREEPAILYGRSVIPFVDMIWLPHAHGWMPEQFDRIIIDEAQDMSAARTELVLNALRDGGRVTALGDDNQCISIDTPIDTPDGSIKASELKPGDQVLSWRNANVLPQTVKHVKKSDWTWGYKITTESGKELTMSPNHKIWATEIDDLTDDEHLVYMMYRSGFGFRVGITNRGKEKVKYGYRPQQEGAEKMWIIERCPSREDALYWEEYYSLRYGIPKCVFRGEARGLNQERINKIYSVFGANGFILLKEKNLKFDLPHWHAYAATDKNVSRRVGHLVAHGTKNTYFAFEWSGNDINGILKENGINVTKAKKKGRYRVRKYTANYRSALAFAEKVRSLVDGLVFERRLYTPDGTTKLITASGLFVGMKVPVLGSNTVKLEKIISIQKIEGSFIDLDIDDASNFFGDGILSHNSIFGFAGSGKNALNELAKTLQAKRLPLSVSYRCATKIIELAKKINPNIEAAPGAQEGTIERINTESLYYGVTPGSAILSRNNFTLIRAAFGLLSRGFRVNIKGKDIGSRFLWRINKCWQSDSIEQLHKDIDQWCEELCVRLSAKRYSTVSVEDEAKSLHAFADHADSIQEVCERIDSFFDKDQKAQITLSTAHKFKGLERDKVYLLRNTFHPERGGEETNVFYVALTRAKDHLVIADGRLAA